jgi:hypothetical protein
MPRSNRPRRPRGSAPVGDGDGGLSSILWAGRRVEEARDGAWNVQPIAGTTAIKTYVCPGCGLMIAAGTPHLVAWRADGLMGDEDDLAARRHWHTHCWRIR